MKILFHREFEKRYRALSRRERKRFKEQLTVFLRDPFDSVLRNHPLKGRYRGYRSINVGGDLRALYRLLDDTTALFVTVDTHGKLYR